MLRNYKQLIPLKVVLWQPISKYVPFSW